MDKDELKNRINKYINSDHCCPIAAGIIAELQGIVRGQNRALEKNRHWMDHNMSRIGDLNQRVDRIEKRMSSEEQNNGD